MTLNPLRLAWGLWAWLLLVPLLAVAALPIVPAGLLAIHRGLAREGERRLEPRPDEAIEAEADPERPGPAPGVEQLCHFVGEL